MVAAIAAVVPVPLAGDELRVPCVDGAQRRYLSFDAAAATGAALGSAKSPLAGIAAVAAMIIVLLRNVAGRRSTNRG